MVTPQERRKGQARSRIWFGVIFFLLCYAWLWLFVKPHLIYDAFGTLVRDVPVFATGWQPLKDSLGVPGGLTVYVYGLLSQGYYYSWLGALLVVLMALCLWALARGHYACAGHPRAAVLPYLPAITVVLLYNHYDHPLAACIALSMGLFLSLVFQKLPAQRVPVQVAGFCLAAGVGYWLGGAGAAFVFAIVTVVHRLIRREWLIAILALPATAVIIWGLAGGVFALSPNRAFLALTPFGREWTEGLTIASRILVVLLYALVPVTLLLIHLSAIVPAKKAHHVRAKGAKPREAFPQQVKQFALPALPAVVLAIALCMSYDKVHRQIVTMNALSREGRWSEVLQLGRRLPKYVDDIYCNHDIDRALFHAGRMGYDLFRFPQNLQALFLTHEQNESCMTQVKMCDTLLEMGNVDLAQTLACEFVVDKGYLATVVEKLAWISIIKGQPNTARMYLNALERDPIHRRRAEAMLAGLDNGFGPDEAEYIRRISSYIRRNGDSARLGSESIEEMLTGLLAQNPHNRMAFEYLMAAYLLAGQIDKIEPNMGRLRDLGYSEIPTLYEEAIVISYDAKRQRLDLNTLPVNRQTIERYKRFVELSDSMQPDNRKAVYQQLLQEFGTSYFFYYRFTVLSQG